MLNKKNSIRLLILVVVVAVIGGAIYFILPGGLFEPQGTQLFEFKPQRADLADWEQEQLYNEYLLVKAALEKDPNYFEALLKLGGIKKTIGDYTGAEQAWELTAQLEPIDPRSFNNLADLYANFSKDYEKAEVNYLLAIEKANSIPRKVIFIRSLYDFYLLYLNDQVKAEKLLLYWSVEIPDHEEFLILLGRLYKDQGKTDLAIDYYQRALKLNPDNQPIAQELEQLKQQ